MGRNNHPKNRQLANIARKKSKHNSYKRVLIVSEGRKTEPNYFNEIRSYYRIPSASVAVLHGKFGTSPKQVVDYACSLLENGDYNLGLKPYNYDNVLVVFDRDQHESYSEALGIVKKYNSDLKKKRFNIVFKAIASVPCFEIWFLLHYRYVQHEINRNDVFEELEEKMEGYSKGGKGYYIKLLEREDIAKSNALKLKRKHNAEDGNNPFTDVDCLVSLLENIVKN